MIRYNRLKTRAVVNCTSEENGYLGRIEKALIKHSWTGITIRKYIINSQDLRDRAMVRDSEMYVGKVIVDAMANLLKGGRR